MPLVRDAHRTQQGILTVARQHFALHGFDRATVRAVAADAGVSPNLITRYFGGKRGLFDAATALDLEVDRVLVGSTADLGARLAEHVVHRWEQRPGDDPLLSMLRAAMTDPEAARRLAHMFYTQGSVPLAAFLGDERAAERAAAVSALLKGVAVDRYVLAAPTVSQADADSVIAWLGPLLQHVLTGPAPTALPRRS